MKSIVAMVLYLDKTTKMNEKSEIEKSYFPICLIIQSIG